MGGYNPYKLRSYNPIISGRGPPCTIRDHPRRTRCFFFCSLWPRVVVSSGVLRDGGGPRVQLVVNMVGSIISHFFQESPA